MLSVLQLGWMMLFILFMGGAILASTLFSSNRWRGKPMFLNIRRIVIPNLSCILLYFGVTKLGVFDPAWGVPPFLGFLLAAGLCLAIAFLVVSFLPPYLSGIFVLGMRAETLRSALEETVQEFDPSAWLDEEVWNSRNLDLRIKVLPGFGRMHNRISLRGKDAVVAYEEMLPLLAWHLEQVVPSRMDQLVQQGNRIIMFVFLVGIFAVIAGWLAGYDL